MLSLVNDAKHASASATCHGDVLHVEVASEAYYAANEIPRRACHPRDLVNQLLDIARFHRMQPALTDMLVDLTLDSYFVKL